MKKELKFSKIAKYNIDILQHVTVYNEIDIWQYQIAGSHTKNTAQ